MLTLIAVFFLSYLAGSFPTAILVGKVLRGWDFDIRNEGSGNAGGTNVFRVLGWQAGLVVTLVDVFKGMAATLWISKWQPFGTTAYIDVTVMPILAGLAAICGHIWTVFAGFRGGKGVGTAGGMIIALYPIAAVICLLIFVGVVYLTRYVSVGSITAALSLPVVLGLMQLWFHQDVSDALFQFSIIVSILIVFTHRKNIRRLIEGTENRFGKPRTAA